jgi:hypothetical protein
MISVFEKRAFFASVSVAAVVVIACESAGCGGDVAIGKGTSSLSADASAPASDPDPGGVCTKHECSPPQPGDCPLAKCANYDTACAYGKIIHARCVPDPNAGQGSAPPDQCYVIGDCSNEGMPAPDAGTPCDPAKCKQTPSCVSGTPTGVECIQWPVGAAYCVWNYRCE